MTKDKLFPTSRADISPLKPYSDPIEWIHRGTDGWIPFQKINPDGTFIPLYSVQASDLKNPGLFDSLADDLEIDSYFGINPMIHPGGKANPHHPTLPRALRKADKVKYLTANFSDLDFYNLKMELPEVVAGVIRYQAAGVIPPASFFADSGRGLWVFWLLRDSENPDGPPRAFSEKKIIWARIQNELYNRLSLLGADKQSRDLARITRVPGSNNSKVSRRVACWIQADVKGRPFMYTLNGLKDSLGITADSLTPLEARLEAERKAILITPPGEKKPLPAPWDGKEKTKWGTRKGGPLSERGKKGWKGRWIHALNDFKTLWGLRGAFVQGEGGNHAVFIYALILWKHGYNAEDIALRVGKLGRECIPPIPEYHIRNAVKSSRKYQKIHNAEIADMLKIHPDEAALLEKWPPMGTARPVKESANANGQREARRATILKIVDEVGKAPSLRDLREILFQRLGEDWAIGTLKRDYAALKVKNPRRRVKNSIDKPSLF
jgi:hypothetical protein